MLTLRQIGRKEHEEEPHKIEVTPEDLGKQGEQGQPIRSEQELVEAAGCKYVRIMATDHMRPTDEQTEAFIKLVRSLGESDALHLHCRAGMGRTTTYMLMYDMLRNAHHVGFDDIVKRQSELGAYGVFNWDPESKHKDCYTERKKFIREFYAYAQRNPGGIPKNWSEREVPAREPARAEG